jgi:hypothetical protein
MTTYPRHFEQVAARLSFSPEPPPEPRELSEEEARETETDPRPSPGWADPSEGQQAARWAFKTSGPDDPMTAFSAVLSLDPTEQPDPDVMRDDDLLIDFMDRRYGRKPTTDSVASYRPWHVHGRRWGVYFSASYTLALSAATARELGEPVWRVAPLVLRQVLRHELVHFAFEVAGTQIEDVLGCPRYLSYLHDRYRQTSRFGQGPLEEAVASHAEIAFARSRAVTRAGLSSRGYEAVIARHLLASGPGYKDFGLMRPDSRGSEVVAEVAASIADRPLSTARWDQVSPAEKRQVPTYWVGDPSGLAIVGGIPKTAAAPSIRATERWLRRIGATLDLNGGKGSHAKATLPSGRVVTYARGHGALLRPEARKLAQAVGLRNERELFLAVSK